MIINETPIRTSNNFKANNIDINDFEFMTTINDFNNRTIYIKSEKEMLVVNEARDKDSNIIYEDTNLIIQNEQIENEIKYGISSDFIYEVNNKSNQKIRIIAKNQNANVNINFEFDENNKELIDNINVETLENSNLNLIINYIPKKEDNTKSNFNSSIFENEELEKNSETINNEKNVDENITNEYYHNGLLNVKVGKNSKINIVIVNLLTIFSNNFLDVQNEIYDDSNLDFTIIDLGGKNSISNYYSDIIGNNAKNNLNTIYLGEDNQIFDLNYIAHLKGEKSSINMEIQGALKDNANKHFKGTIDFKKGAKKSIGNENENCLLLSDKAKSLALPILLCSEEDVIGNHATSSGKASNKDLFYLESRGFTEKEAMKLLVKAKFNKILSNIKSQELIETIDEAIDNKLN